MTRVLSAPTRRAAVLGGLAVALAAGTAAPAMAGTLPVRHYKVVLSAHKQTQGPSAIKTRYNSKIQITYTTKQHAGLLKVRAYALGGKPLGGWVTLKVPNRKYTLNQTVLKAKPGTGFTLKWEKSTAGKVQGALYY